MYGEKNESLYVCAFKYPRQAMEAHSSSNIGLQVSYLVLGSPVSNPLFGPSGGGGGNFFAHG